MSALDGRAQRMMNAVFAQHMKDALSRFVAFCRERSRGEPVIATPAGSQPLSLLLNEYLGTLKEERDA